MPLASSTLELRMGRGPQAVHTTCPTRTREWVAGLCSTVGQSLSPLPCGMVSAGTLTALHTPTTSSDLLIMICLPSLRLDLRMLWTFAAVYTTCPTRTRECVAGLCSTVEQNLSPPLPCGIVSTGTRTALHTPTLASDLLIMSCLPSYTLDLRV